MNNFFSTIFGGGKTEKVIQEYKKSNEKTKVQQKDLKDEEVNKMLIDKKRKELIIQGKDLSHH